ncbi:MAG: hypothetical protein AAFU71_10610 [Cyanobacteria bacterium J06632_22]
MDINAAITTNAYKFVIADKPATSFDGLSSWFGLSFSEANDTLACSSMLNSLGMSKQVQRLAGAHLRSIDSGYFGMRSISGILVSDYPYSQPTEGPARGLENDIDGLAFHNLEDETLNLLLRSGVRLRARPI